MLQIYPLCSPREHKRSSIKSRWIRIKIYRNWPRTEKINLQHLIGNVFSNRKMIGAQRCKEWRPSKWEKGGFKQRRDLEKGIDIIALMLQMFSWFLVKSISHVYISWIMNLFLFGFIHFSLRLGWMLASPSFFTRPIWPCHDKCCVNSGRIWIGRVLVGHVGLVACLLGWLVGWLVG